MLVRVVSIGPLADVAPGETMNRRRTKTYVRSSSGQLLELTREQCEAVELSGERCRSREFRDELGRVLCWTHRQAAKSRGVLELELSGEHQPFELGGLPPGARAVVHGDPNMSEVSKNALRSIVGAAAERMK